MASLILFLINFYLGTFPVERAAYLLGPDSFILNQHEYKYISSSKHPFILVFEMNSGQDSLTGITLSYRFREDESLTQFRDRIKGRWLVFPIEFHSLAPVPQGIIGFGFDDDIVEMIFSPILIRLHYRLKHYGPLKLISICFYAKEDEIRFAKSPFSQLGFGSLYLLRFGPFGLLWQPVKGRNFGTISLCLKIQRPIEEKIIQLIARSGSIKR